MSTKQIAGNKKESSKEKLLADIVLRLNQALPMLKEQLGQKKFDKRIRKAGKLLLEGIKPAPGEVDVKGTVKKASTPPAKKSAPAKKLVKKSVAK